MMTVEQAYKFSKWLAGDKGHLPSIKQWDTAAGRYRPDRGKGPYTEPAGPGDIAINSDSPLPVGTASKDVSLFGVYDMAGNGLEFTRSIFGQALAEVPLEGGNSTIGVSMRGQDNSAPVPLQFTDMEGDTQGSPWPYSDPSPNTGFRVVIQKLAVPST
jgi:formylglycine-generating enzyme required for sulfatase activity